MPEAFFRYECGAQLSPGRYADPSGICSADAYYFWALLQHLTGNRLEQFTLPIARDPRNSENFTGSDGKMNIVKCNRKRPARPLRQAFHLNECRLRRCGRFDRVPVDDVYVTADHHACKRGGRFCSRIALADNLAMPQYRRAIAEPPDLFEPDG